MAAENGPDLAGLLRRLEAVEQRLARLEAVRGEPAQPLPGAPDDSHPESAEAIPTVLPGEQPPSPAVGPALAAAEPLPERLPPPHGDIEQVLGLKWAGWVGAIVLVIGVGLGIKFAFDQGWFGQLPVTLRLLVMSLGGFALLAAGEVVYRRVNVLSAVGLFGAGVAVLFLVSYAGNVYYAAYDYRTAFAFAALATVIGSAVAVRGRLVSIAVLAQVGGQLGPLVLGIGQSPGVPLLAYLLMLQVVALILALWGQSAKWWVLRGLSLAATAWWVLVALGQGRWGPGLANEVLWFAVLYAAASQGELLRSALLAGEGRPPRDVPTGLGSVFSLLVTAGLTAVCLHVFYDHDSRLLRGCTTLTLAGLSLAGAVLLRPGANPLLHALTVSYRVQGVALLMLFVPVTFTGLWVSPAWGVLSLAFAVLGARFDRELTRGAALLTWGLALVRWAGGPAGETWLTVLGHPIRDHTVLGWLLAGVGEAVAWFTQADLVHRDRGADPDWRPWAIAVSVGASVVWVVASLAGLPRLGGTLALVAWAWLLVAADRVRPSPEFAGHALAVLLFAAAKWVTVDALDGRPGRDTLEYLPVLNPVFGLGVLLALSLAGFTWLRRSALDRLLSQFGDRPVPAAVTAFGVAALVLGLIGFGLALEVDRGVEWLLALGYAPAWPVWQVKLFGLTLLGVALVLTLAAAARRLAYPNALPWALMLLVVGKFALIDMLLARLANERGPAAVAVLFNFQVLTAAGVLAGLFALRRLLPPASLGPVTAEYLGVVAGLLALLIVLLAGTLEIDRAFSGPLAAGLRDPGLAKQVAISLFWSAFAIALVGAGFRFRAARLRYAGLGLFAGTLLKVALVDVNQVRHGYRILSLLGLGLVLLATSVLYGRLSKRMGGAGAATGDESPAPPPESPEFGSPG